MQNPLRDMRPLVNKNWGTGSYSARGRRAAILTLLAAVTLALFVLDLITGSSAVTPAQAFAVLTGRETGDFARAVVLDIRLLKAVTALAAGAALCVSGLQMQTVFNNPLAGPYVLGISSGASLGVALFVLGAPALGLATGAWGTAAAAWTGAALTLGAISLAALRVRNIMMLLILGMMFSAAISAAVQVLQYLSRDEALKNFVIWTMGSLGEVTGTKLTIMLIAIAIGFILAVATVKPMNVMLLGQEYARIGGINLPRSQWLIFTSTTLLAGTVTAFCGPIGFIGMAVPHIARVMMRTANNATLLPATALLGASLLLGCDMISKIYLLPINAITALVGIPAVVWIVWRQNPAQ